MSIANPGAGYTENPRCCQLTQRRNRTLTRSCHRRTSHTLAAATLTSNAGRFRADCRNDTPGGGGWTRWFGPWLSRSRRIASSRLLDADADARSAHRAAPAAWSPSPDVAHARTRGVGARLPRIAEGLRM